MHRFRAPLIWVCLSVALIVPLMLAAQSPLLAWRDPVYIAAGFAGIAGLGLCLLQPLLAKGALPGMGLRRGRQLHRTVGVLLLASVIVHVAGLWMTSPPDVVDALLFRSPTLFTPFGVIAMWAVFGAALLAASRKRFRPGYATWRAAHVTLALVIVVGTVFHAVLIDGTMEPVTKWILSALVLCATMFGIRKQRF